MHHRLTATLAAGALALSTAALGLTSSARAAAPEVTVPVPGDTATVSAPSAFAPGETLTIRGNGWLNSAKTRGSLIGIKFDSNPGDTANTVFTRRSVTHPETGAVVADKSTQAIALADTTGAWSVTIPAPTPTNAYYGNQAGTPAITGWASGQVHSFRLLSGSLGSAFGDTTRSVKVEFCIGSCATQAGTAPAYGHVSADHADGATVWVEDSPSTAAGAKLRVKGKGWNNADLSAGSTIDVSFNRGGAGDAGAPAVIQADIDGNFETEVALPSGLSAGDYLSASFRSGPYANGDVARTVTTGLLKVGGVAYVPPVVGGTTCTPTTSGPTVKLGATSAPLGGTIAVSGTGWCHPTNGGSVVAVKIDDGAISHLAANKVKDDLTIWATFDADPKDGTFSGQITLPDGTAATSKPALSQGAHTLRFLSGTLKTGDKVRTLESPTLTVGAYRPNGQAEPVEATEELTKATRGKLSLSRSGTTLTVTIPAAQPGEWIYLNVYDGGSPLFPWASTWLRANAKKQVTVSLKGIDLPAGDLKLTAQSGDLATSGDLLGWGILTIAATSTAPTPGSGTTVTPAAVVPGVGLPGAGSAPAPAQAPATPVLTTANRGLVAASVSGTSVVLKTPATLGSWIHVTLFNGDTAIPVGWLQARMDGTVTLDATALPAGHYRLAAQSTDGALLGWTTVSVGTPGAAAAASASTTASPADLASQTVAPALVSHSLPLWRVRDLDAILMAAAFALLAGTAVGVGVGARPRRKLI